MVTRVGGLFHYKVLGVAMVIVEAVRGVEGGGAIWC